MIVRRAAVWHGRHDVRIDERAMPPLPGSGMVRIAVDWCGICGSDLLEYSSGPVVIPPPVDGVSGASVVLGHEFVGTIVVVGDQAGEWSAGDRVAVDTLVRCGECAYCRSGAFNLCPYLGVLGLTMDGGLAELVDVPSYMCYRLDGRTTGDLAALVEPLAVAVRAVRRATAVELGRVVVLGCGSIGLLCLLTARHQGIRELVAVDVAVTRRQAATRAGATAVSARVPELAYDHGPWAFIDCTGSANVASQVVEAAPAQSRIALVGVTAGEVFLPLIEVLEKELELVGSLSHDASDFEKAIQLLSDTSFDAGWLITRRIVLDDLPSTIATLAEDGDANELKVLVTPTERHE